VGLVKQEPEAGVYPIQVFPFPQSAFDLHRIFALQVAVRPPFKPAHVHVHCPLSFITDEAVPAEHVSAIVDGAVVLMVPFAVPHTPSSPIKIKLSLHCPKISVSFNLHH
jgi:hypothetical protein